MILIKYKIGQSEIHGLGLIAADFIKQGEIIGTAIVLTTNGPVITSYLGKYVNHSLKANSCLVAAGLQYNLVATTNIQAETEIVSNYNHTPAFVEKPGADFI